MGPGVDGRTPVPIVERTRMARSQTGLPERIDVVPIVGPGIPPHHAEMGRAGPDPGLKAVIDRIASRNQGRAVLVAVVLDRTSGSEVLGVPAVRRVLLNRQIPVIRQVHASEARVTLISNAVHPAAAKFLLIGEVVLMQASDVTVRQSSLAAVSGKRIELGVGHVRRL